MSTTPIQVRIDDDLKKKIERICKQLGIDIPTAVRMFFTRMVVEQGIPFDMKCRDYGDDDYFTDDEVRSITQAYKESFEVDQLAGPFTSAEEFIADLHSKND